MLSLLLQEGDCLHLLLLKLAFSCRGWCRCNWGSRIWTGLTWLGPNGQTAVPLLLRCLHLTCPLTDGLTCHLLELQLRCIGSHAVPELLSGFLR